MVSAMVRVGTPQDEVAAVLEISPGTLRTHFRRELDAAMAVANATVGTKLFDLATGGNLTAIIFWLKCRAGWKDQPAGDGTREAKPPDFVVELTGDAASKETLQ